LRSRHTCGLYAKVGPADICGVSLSHTFTRVSVSPFKRVPFAQSAQLCARQRLVSKGTTASSLPWPRPRAIGINGSQSVCSHAATATAAATTAASNAGSAALPAWLSHAPSLPSAASSCRRARAGAQPQPLRARSSLVRRSGGAALTDIISAQAQSRNHGLQSMPQAEAKVRRWIAGVLAVYSDAQVCDVA